MFACETGGVSSVPGRPAAEDHRAGVCTQNEQPRGIVGALLKQADAPATPAADERGVWTWYTHTNTPRRSSVHLLRNSYSSEPKPGHHVLPFRSHCYSGRAGHDGRDQEKPQ